MTQPQLTPIDSVEITAMHRHTTRNGVGIYTLPTDDFEVLRITFVFRAGSSVQHQPFAASATANLLAEGSRRFTAQQITEQLDYHGSWFNVNIDRDYAYISFAMLSKFYRETLDIAAEILLHPTFPEEELRTYCTKRKQRLTIDRKKVDIEAREAFARAMFGSDHPYGVSYSEEEYDRLTREAVERFYREFYTAENCFVVCSGRIGEEETAAIDAIAEALPHSPAHERVEMERAESGDDCLVDHPDAVQSSIRIGRLLFPRQHPDFVGMQVVATLLGGYFGSRLMHNLREEHGYTYGVMAAMVNFEKEGYMAIGAQVGTEVTQAAITEIYREIARMREERVTEEELELVKNIMAGEMMRILDGPFGIADVAIENILCGFDNSSLNDNLREIQSMTPQRVQELAQRYLRQEDLVTVVAGDSRHFADNA